MPNLKSLSNSIKNGPSRVIKIRSVTGASTTFFYVFIVVYEWIRICFIACSRVYSPPSLFHAFLACAYLEVRFNAAICRKLFLNKIIVPVSIIAGFGYRKILTKVYFWVVLFELSIYVCVILLVLSKIGGYRKNPCLNNP